MVKLLRLKEFVIYETEGALLCRGHFRNKNVLCWDSLFSIRVEGSPAFFRNSSARKLIFWRKVLKGIFSVSGEAANLALPYIPSSKQELSHSLLCLWYWDSFANNNANNVSCTPSSLSAASVCFDPCTDLHFHRVLHTVWLRF